MTGGGVDEVLSAVDPWRPEWADPFGPTVSAADDYEAMVQALRDVQEAVTRSRPTPGAAAEAAEALRAVARLMHRHEVDEDRQIAGKRWLTAGKGHALAPVLHIVDVTDTTATARVTIGRFHSGRYALNGGVTPLIFDELLARLANSAGRPWGRTAYLNVNYRAPAPLHRELRVTAELVGQQGRKRTLRGALYVGETLLADVEGLWVELKPEQTHNTSLT
ncbi:PaaI family thioesterase [Gordonia terrae]|uniref:PaaI family thioesterase n=1 Tax=Gordonia terrae TaxID=2055 RepID=UPI003F6D5A53